MCNIFLHIYNCVFPPRAHNFQYATADCLSLCIIVVILLLFSRRSHSFVCVYLLQQLLYRRKMWWFLVLLCQNCTTTWYFTCYRFVNVERAQMKLGKSTVDEQNFFLITSLCQMLMLNVCVCCCCYCCGKLQMWCLVKVKFISPSGQIARTVQFFHFMRVCTLGTDNCVNHHNDYWERLLAAAENQLFTSTHSSSSINSAKCSFTTTVCGVGGVLLYVVLSFAAV